MSDNISVDTSITIKIKDQEFKLTRDEAVMLQTKLNTELGNVLTVPTLPMPSYPHYPWSPNPSTPWQPVWYSNGTDFIFSPQVQITSDTKPQA
jgi:hypothetical protein